MKPAELKAEKSLKNEAIRAQFPILSRKVNGRDLVYLDNAASSQKPIAVMDAIKRYYSEEHSNVHRGVHFLSQLATDRLEEARNKLAAFLNAKHSREVIYTRGTTEGINLVANSIRHSLKPGDEILITGMEHHSNIVPWQMAIEGTGAKLIVARVHDDGSLDEDDFYSKLGPKTKLVSMVHISNALGTINPLKEAAKAAHHFGALMLVDGAQSAHHTRIDVQELDCDFFAGSGHKMYGPTGIGFLYGKADVLESLPPYQGGGGMIAEVTFEKTTYNELPFKFEAGTPHIEGAIALGAAVDFINGIGHDAIARIEGALLDYAHARLREIDGMRFVGTAPKKAGVVSFLVEGTHPYDVGAIIDKLGVAVRTGHHCTQPLMARLGIPGTVRASFAVYNTLSEIDVLAHSVERAANMLRK
jgi:cysteine desulfurase/selenocysteine lyase